jgi:alpha-galactosidase
VGTQFVLPKLVVESMANRTLLRNGRTTLPNGSASIKTRCFRAETIWGDLYDIGFDRPEAHAIRKGGEMYYAFFARHWRGSVELRGLEDRNYHVVDYVNGKDFGTVHGPHCFYCLPPSTNTFCSKRNLSD